MRTIKTILKEFINFYNRFNEDYKSINLDDPIQLAVVYSKLLEKVYTENGCYWFKRFIIGNMAETGSGGIRWNGLMNKWDKIERKYKDNYLLFLCARSHGKTTKFSIIDPIYDAFVHQNYQQVIISAGAPQAELIIRDIRTIIENNEILKKLADFKHWSTEFLGFNGGFIIARGVGAEIRGLHPHKVILDDILRSDEKLSHDKIKSYVFEDIIPAIAPKKGRLVLVGTKKDSTDIFTVIEDMIKDGATKWKLFKFPGILDKENKIALAPDLHSFDELIEMKKTMGAIEFEKEIMCEAIGEGSRIFPEELLEIAIDKTLSYEYKSEKDRPYYAGADIARSGAVSADWTASIFIKVEEEFKRMVVSDIYHKKGIKIRNQVKDIAVLCQKFNGAILLVEENNFGKDFIDIMIDESNTAVETIKTTDRTKEDIVRILLIALENEKLKFPYRSIEDKRKTELILNELRHYVVKKTPGGNEKMEASGGYHDDIVDALGFAVKCAQGSGMDDPGKMPTERGSDLEHMMDLNLIPEKETMEMDRPSIL